MEAERARGRPGQVALLHVSLVPFRESRCIIYPIRAISELDIFPGPRPVCRSHFGGPAKKSRNKNAPHAPATPTYKTGGKPRNHEPRSCRHSRSYWHGRVAIYSTESISRSRKVFRTGHLLMKRASPHDIKKGTLNTGSKHFAATMSWTNFTQPMSCVKACKVNTDCGAVTFSVRVHTRRWRMLFEAKSSGQRE